MTDADAMRRALHLALRGTGKVSPNPRVGCVILRNGQIIAEGWHDHYGGLHAEVHALRSVTEPLVGEDVTMVVNLEPCAHHGKQPPCTDAIIATKQRPDGTFDPERGIKRVVIGMRDPNPQAQGGIDRLRQVGIEVTVGVLETECRWVNRFFVKHVTTGMPYILGKAAISLDGFLATPNGTSQWISCEESRRRAHALRAEVDAVLVGRGTIERDNPQLGPRLVRGTMPRRIVLDSALRIPKHARVLSDDYRTRTIVVTSREHADSPKADALRSEGITVVGVSREQDGRLALGELFAHLGKEMMVASILIEGGGTLLSWCIERGYLDELHLFVAPMTLGRGQSFTGALSEQSLEQAPRMRYHAVARSGVDAHLILLAHHSRA